MSPEQLTGREVTVRSDVYALRLVLYEIFTGASRQDTRGGRRAQRGAPFEPVEPRRGARPRHRAGDRAVPRDRPGTPARVGHRGRRGAARWRSPRRGTGRWRGDRVGARRVGALGAFVSVVGLGLLGYMRALEPSVIFIGISFSLFSTMAFWLTYPALEPVVRRRWPHTLASWTRLLSGQVARPAAGAGPSPGRRGGRRPRTGGALGLPGHRDRLRPMVDSPALLLECWAAAGGALAAWGFYAAVGGRSPAAGRRVGTDRRQGSAFAARRRQPFGHSPMPEVP